LDVAGPGAHEDQIAVLVVVFVAVALEPAAPSIVECWVVIVVSLYHLDFVDGKSRIVAVAVGFERWPDGREMGHLSL